MSSCVCVYLVLMQQSVCVVQQYVCLCVLLCGIVQVCVCTSQRFHADSGKSGDEAEPVINHRPGGQEVHLQQVEVRL